MYCPKCGEIEVSKPGICEKCKDYLNSRDIFKHKCAVCKKRADVMFVYGFRCNEHKEIKTPSNCIITENFTFTFSEVIT